MDGTDRLLRSMRQERRRAVLSPSKPDWVCQHCSENSDWHRRQALELLLTVGEAAARDWEAEHGIVRK